TRARVTPDVMYQTEIHHLVQRIPPDFAQLYTVPVHDRVANVNVADFASFPEPIEDSHMTCFQTCLLPLFCSMHIASKGVNSPNGGGPVGDGTSAGQQPLLATHLTPAY